MKVDEILEKAKDKLKLRRDVVKKLNHEKQAYIIDQVQARFPGAIFENGKLSCKTPKDIYCKASSFINNDYIRRPKDHIDSHPVLKEITKKITKIEREISKIESALNAASKYTDVVNTFKNELLSREDLLNDLKELEEKIEWICVRIDSAKSDYYACIDNLNDLKDLLANA